VEQSQAVPLQLAHWQLAQPQGDGWVVSDDEAAWVSAGEEIISGLQRVLVKPGFFASSAFST
jgi:hypothetical protein